MKARKKIVVRLVIAVSILYLLPAVLLQIPYFQNTIAQSAVGYLEKKIGTEVRIGKVDFNLFNQLMIRDVYVEDQQGDTLLAAKRVAAGFDWLPLLKKQFRFRSVQLYTFSLHLNRATPESALNIQYIIDAFRSETPTEPEPVDLHIQSLLLKNGAVSYRVGEASVAPGRFRPDQLLWRNIDGKIGLRALTGDSFSASVQRLRATEQSGLNIEQLSFDLSADSEGAKVRQLDLKLPQSMLHLTDVAVDFPRDSSVVDGADGMRIDLHIDPSQIRLNDLSALLPFDARFEEPIDVQGSVAGVWDDLRLKDFRMSSGREMRLAFDAAIRQPDPADRSRVYINGRIHDSHITAEGMQQVAYSIGAPSLPRPLQRLRSMSLEGEVLGLLNNLTAVLQLQTGVGDLRADVHFGREQAYFLQGDLSSTGIRLNALTDNADWGSTRFAMHLNTTFTNEKDVEGTIEANVNELNYKSYGYENIAFSGAFTSDSFNGSLKAGTPDGQLAAAGSFVLKGEDSQFAFTAEAKDLLLDRLHWTKKPNDERLSFAVDAAFTGNRPDNLTGRLAFRDLLFSNSKGGYAMDTLIVAASEDNHQKRIEIRSDLLTGQLEGIFSFRTLVGALKQTAAACLPSLIPAVPPLADDSVRFQWHFAIHDTLDLSPVLKLPLTFFAASQVDGEYHHSDHHICLKGDFPWLQFGSSIVKNGTLELDNNRQASEIHLRINGTQQQRKGNELMLSAHLQVANDSIRSSLRWNNSGGSKSEGGLDFDTHLSYRPGEYPLSASIRVQPSEMILNDSVWTLSPTAVVYQDGRISIDRLEASHNRQRIIVRGEISKDADDQIHASLNAVDLDYVFQSLQLRNLTFGGIATGYITAKDVYDTRQTQVETQLSVRSFSFNHVDFGNLSLSGNWDRERKGVKMQGNAFSNDSTYVLVNGYIYPARQEISIDFDPHRGNAAFLRKYVNTIAKDLSGEISGHLRLFGNWNDPTVEGGVWVENASFGIDFLNTRYTFSDSIRLTPDEITLSNATFYDEYGNKAIASGSVHHTLFDKFRFSAQLAYENFLIFNATSRTNPSFYGKAFATGTATLGGTEDQVDIDLTLQNNDNTAITLNFMEQTDVADYDFINFITRQQTPSLAPLPPPPPASRTDIRTNLMLTANPGATLEIVMDPATGDKISGAGEGSLQIQYSTRAPLRVLGNYRIERGSYNFSFQQALFRNFEIQEGSTINFLGDPTAAALDIQATYTVSANLDDLDQQLVQQTQGGGRAARDNIPVNCVLLLTGPLEQPAVKFDLQFPGASSEIERQVKNYIRTDDMLNRQIVSLLLLGRFYKAPEYTRNDTRTNNDLSLLISSLPSYLLSMLGNVSDKVRVDTKFRQTYESGGTNTEMELLLSGNLLNNRLIINGNFGYINNPYLNTLNSNAPLIGDFDIEYKLTKSGDIRLKGFNRYNYRNYYSLTPEMTQGFGILFRRDFNSFHDLFFRRRRMP